MEENTQNTEQDFILNFESELEKRGIKESFYKNKTKELFGQQKKVYAEKQEEALLELVPNLGLDIPDDTLKSLVDGKDYSEKNKAVISYIANMAKDLANQNKELQSTALTDAEREEMKKQIQTNKKTLKEVESRHQQEMLTVKQEAFSRIVFDRFKSVIDTVRQNIPESEESALEMLELQESQLPTILRDFRVEEGEVIYETANAKGHKTTGLIFYHPDSETPIQTKNHFFPTAEQFLKEYFLKKTVLGAIGKNEPRGGIESGQPNSNSNNTTVSSFNPNDVRALQSHRDAYDYAEKYVDGLIFKNEVKKSSRELEITKILSKIRSEYLSLTGQRLK